MIRKVLNNYIYMISTTTIDNNKILTKNIISNNITCNGSLIFKYANENVSIGIHDPTTHGEIFNVYSGNYKNYASGNYSHAEGLNTRASGNYSHAEGNSTTSLGSYSHAEGSGTTASGNGSHTEGDASRALGDYSHAQNNVTIADYKSMTAIGKCNISNTNEVVNKKKNKLFVVGNGISSSSSDRRDAFIITEEGNMFITGNLYVKGDIIQEIGDTNWISNDYFNNLN